MKAHIIDRNGRIAHGPHFGLSLRDGLDFARLVPAPEAMLDGRRIEQVQRHITFAIEYSARAAWEAVYRLLRRGPAPPAVYQGQYDLKALFAALGLFPSPGTTRP